MLKQSTSSSASSGSLTSRAPVSRNEGAKGNKGRRREEENLKRVCVCERECYKEDDTHFESE
jgi:hypothetical protein